MTAVQYTAGMPLDVVARVTANDALSSDFTVLALHAPAIAAASLPGQFVMIKAAAGFDPLLRRPFSIFEILRDASGAPVGFSILCKRIGPATTKLYDARPGQDMAVLGPLGRGFTQVDPPTEAWMVAGGVGLAPFAELAQALQARGTRTVLFYGARRATELFYLDWFAARGVELVLTTEDGSRGEPGRVVAPLDRRLLAMPAAAPVQVYACGPEGMLKAVAATAASHERPCEVSVERIMGCGMGGCYSCIVPMKDGHGRYHHVRSCLAGPVLDAAEVVWE